MTPGERLREAARLTTDFQPGDWVTYRPYPGAQAEDGEVVRVSDGGLVFVLYRGDRTPKATRPGDLTRGGAR